MWVPSPSNQVSVPLLDVCSKAARRASRSAWSPDTLAWAVSLLLPRKLDHLSGRLDHPVLSGDSAASCQFSVSQKSRWLIAEPGPIQLLALLRHGDLACDHWPLLPPHPIAGLGVWSLTSSIVIFAIHGFSFALGSFCPTASLWPYLLYRGWHLGWGLIYLYSCFFNLTVALWDGYSHLPFIKGETGVQGQETASPDKRCSQNWNPDWQTTNSLHFHYSTLPGESEVTDCLPSCTWDPVDFQEAPGPWPVNDTFPQLFPYAPEQRMERA